MTDGYVLALCGVIFLGSLGVNGFFLNWHLGRIARALEKLAEKTEGR